MISTAKKQTVTKWHFSKNNCQHISYISSNMYISWQSDLICSRKSKFFLYANLTIVLTIFKEGKAERELSFSSTEWRINCNSSVKGRWSRQKPVTAINLYTLLDSPAQPIGYSSESESAMEASKKEPLTFLASSHIWATLSKCSIRRTTTTSSKIFGFNQTTTWRIYIYFLGGIEKIVVRPSLISTIANSIICIIIDKKRGKNKEGFFCSCFSFNNICIAKINKVIDF